MEREHNLQGKLKISTFLKKIEAYGEKNIEATAHTFMRLSEKQRKIYTEKELKRVIIKLKPIEIQIQENKNYAVIYSYKNDKLLKIILDLGAKKVYIVTFYFLSKRQREFLKK